MFTLLYCVLEIDFMVILGKAECMRAKKTNNRNLLNNSLHKFFILAVINVRCKGF